MLGYDDAYDSIGCNGGVIYDNLRVISYLPFSITKVTVTGGNVELSFTDSGSGPYTVEASTNAGSGYGAVAATITGSGGNYLAKVPYSAGTPAKFYRIKR